MKKHKKKIFKRVLIAMAILTLAILLVNPVRTLVGVFQMTQEDNNYMDVQDFNAYYKDYLAIVNVALRNKHLSINSKECFLSADHNKKGVFLSYNGHLIGLSVKDRRSLSKVDESFGSDVTFDGVRVNKNIVSFETEQGLYSIIYFQKGYRPELLRRPPDGFKYKTVKIRSHWYHVKAVPKLL